MATYVLIHGAHHGTWCWDLVRPELERRGHQTIAVDLPADDPRAGLARCVEVICDAIAGAGDDLVLVGHSLAGVFLPVVATLRPVAQLVYLAAVVPQPGRSLVEQRAMEPDMEFESTAIDNGDGTQSRSVEEAIRIYYHDCSEERIKSAVECLRRQSQAPHHEKCPIAVFPHVPVSYIVCADDRALRPSRQRDVARHRLGVEPLEIPGSHSPFLARPAELAEILANIG